MKLKFALLTLLLALAGINMKGQIPLAGVYEGSDVNLICNRKMYVVLDFLKGTPDFTQQFTTKESTFKVLPKDFMNAKKISKAFAGTTAPGFSRYRSKVLFNNWEEMKITNPRLKNGVIVCDWVDTYDRKGKCAILRLPNDSITIYGLTALEQSISPDGLRLELVKSLLPAGTEQLPVLSLKDRQEYQNAFMTDCRGTIERLDKIKETPKTQTTPTPSPETKEKPADTFPVLWREDGPTLYECHIRDKGGDYGYFETISKLDFWGDERVKGQDIACREFTNCTYENGRMYEYEYIYYGHKEGNKVIFTHRTDMLNGEGEVVEKLETPEILTATSDGKGLIFHEWKYKRTY